MKKIIILTILGAVFLSFIIYQCFYHELVQIVALGDGIATGETYYDVTGYSFNDYLRDYFEETKQIDEYIKEFADKKETSETLKGVGVVLQGYNSAEKYELVKELIAPHLNGMFVTPKDIDDTVRRISYTISEAMNMLFAGKEKIMQS